MEWIIIGLGNPGKEYEETRHNVGRMVAENLRVSFGFEEWSKNGLAKALESKGTYNSKPVRLLMPETYMNLSGLSARVFVKSKEDKERLIVVHDDIDLSLGRMKISVDSGSGGHRGVESIIDHLMTTGFVRVRIGICPIGADGRPQKPGDPDFVVNKFLPSEKEIILESVKKATGAVEKIIGSGTEVAMNEFNRNE